MPLRPADWTRTSASLSHDSSAAAAAIPPPDPPLGQRRKLRSYTRPRSMSTYTSLAGIPNGSSSTSETGTPLSTTPASDTPKKQKKQKYKTHCSVSLVKDALPMPLEEGASLHQGLVKLAETYNIPNIAAAIEMSLKASPPRTPNSNDPPSSLKRPAEPSPSEAWVQKRLRIRQRVPSIPPPRSDSPPPVPPKDKEKVVQLPSRSAGARERLSIRGFGRTDDRGRHYCTFIEPNTNQVCGSWTQGYTTWSDLARHADAKHAPDEMEMIKKGILTYKTAQWVKSESQFDILKEVCGLTCSKCGTSFGSGRYDSLNRHKSNGACERAIKRHKLEAAGLRVIPPAKEEGGNALVDDDFDEGIL